jgi:molybdenum cofactor cytidylyltransferase
VTGYPSLSAALAVRRGDLVALTGAGGKTAALLRLSRELAAAGWRVLASTTTHVGEAVESSMPVVLVGPSWGPGLAEALAAGGPAFLAGGRTADGKLGGLAPGLVDEIAASGLADVVIVEADGSRQRPLKAPAPHEPVVPASSTVVSFVMGIDALGAPVDGPLVHRSEAVRAFGAPAVTVELMAALAASPEGGLRGVPAGAAARPIVNKAAGARRAGAEAVARTILSLGRPQIDRALVTDIETSAFAAAARPR